MYKGCYNDGFENDVGDIMDVKRGVLSVRSCVDTCQAMNKRVAALQNARYCMCGDDFGQYGQSQDDQSCNKRCAGTEPCGGPWKNAIYEIGTVRSSSYSRPKSKTVTSRNPETLSVGNPNGSANTIFH